MDDTQKEPMSIRKRRNLSKNKGQTARQREKTPEPSRTPVPHEDTTTSDDEDHSPVKNPREIEADNTYEEMKRLVQEKANLKDPVYDLDRDEVLEARALAANERRRRSISPFAIPDKEETTTLERKGSFIDPTNKLLSTNYTLGPKGEDINRRGSLTLETSTTIEKASSLSPPTTANASPRDKNFPYSLPTTPKKLEEMIYPDEVIETKPKEKNSQSNSPIRKDVSNVPEEIQTQTQIPNKSKVSKGRESPSPSGELVTRVIQVERTPSRRLSQDQKPIVEIRERIVRTPSRKATADTKPTLVKQSPSKLMKEEPKSKIPPVKPTRSKSATRFGNKTSESEMSEDQQRHQTFIENIPKRKIVPTPQGSFENAYKCGSRGVKRDFIESLWRGSHSLREDDWKSMARKKLFEFENQLHTAHEAGVTSYSGQRSWNFMNSFVYCLTLITTIGYGHIAPKTTYGRVATIIYAIIGIPLFLIVLADFGKLFTRIIKFFWAFIRRFYYTRSCRKVRRTVPVQEVIKGLNIVYDVVRRPSQIFTEEDIDQTPEDEGPPPVERKSSDVPPPLPPKPGTLKPDVENATEPDTPAPSVFEIDDEFNLPIS
ncbi:unnamed protein product, partial [Iphiclides podalirius]